MAVFDNNTSLREKSSGEKVKTLQTHLKELGYYNKAIDGIYGYYTTQAVRKFQQVYKLSVDGWFGPQTAQKMNSVLENRNTTTSATTTNTTTTASTGAPFDCPNTNLKKDSTNDAEKVKKLQTILKEWKYYTREVDGDYGKYTKQAVIDFQKAAGGLLLDGEFGPATCKKLVERYLKEHPNAASTEKKKTEKKKDSIGNPVAEKPPDYKLVVHPSVVVLPETTLEVTSTEDGNGTKTATVNHSLTGGSISTDTNFDCTKIDLKKNSKGEDVKKLQTILKARGYYTRQIDGEYGDYTVAAVKRLQQVQGNDPDGWFGQKTCQKLQGTSTTSSSATGTKDKKNKDYTFEDFSSVPMISKDMEGITHDVTVKIPFEVDLLNRVRRLQRTTFTMHQDTILLVEHKGYIKDIKVTQEDNGWYLELQITGFNVFLEQTIELDGEKTGKRSALLKELIEMAGLKADVDLTGLKDDEYTIKVQKAQTTTSTSSEGGGLVQVSGNDCTGGAMQTNQLSARSFNIDECGGNTKIGNSSANYAVDTANMSAKEAILDARRRFKYGISMTSSASYDDNRRCPQTMWTKTGQFYGNCADIARLIKCLGDVHGLKVGIRHMSGHYYNLIEVNGTTYRFDCCFKAGGSYRGEITNNLTMRGGPWQ